jgi:hypothetical protein
MEGAWVNPSQEQPDDSEGGADAGSIVLGWVTKLALVGAVVGVVGFDGLSVGLAHLSTVDDANAAVHAASQTYLQTHNLQASYNAAAAAVKPTEVVGTTDFAVAPDGTASLSVTNTAHTLLLYRTKSTGKWADITVHATGKYIVS